MPHTKWYDSFEYRPKKNAKIFIWDVDQQKELYGEVIFDGGWKGHKRYPIWRYVFEGNDPDRVSHKETIEISPGAEDGKTEKP